MNCPGHVQIFNAGSVSYRQLPLRLAEFGCCHRNEPSGALNGMFRVRQFVQDDAHIFCEPHQIESEIKAFCVMLDEVYNRFGFTEYEVAVSLRPDDRSGDEALWDQAEESLIKVVEDLGLPYRLLPNEGAFYGPKLEFSLKDSLGRSWQCGTVQLDFVLPERLGARYTGSENQVHTPVMIHRAILGSLERFIAILLEHYSGKLPDWLSPCQIGFIPICDNHREWCDEIGKEIGARFEIDDRDQPVQQRVKEFAERAIPNIIVVGDRELTSGTFPVRRGMAVTNLTIEELRSLLN